MIYFVNPVQATFGAYTFSSYTLLPPLPPSKPPYKINTLFVQPFVASFLYCFLYHKDTDICPYFSISVLHFDIFCISVFLLYNISPLISLSATSAVVIDVSL